MAALPANGRHYARRFSGGLTPALAEEILDAGTGRAWFGRQLRPAQVPDGPGHAVDDWFPSLRRSPHQLFDRNNEGIQGVWEVMADLSRWTVARRIQGRRQVLEQMVDFWSNLLNVPLGDEEAAFWRVDYDRTIRRHALDTFESLLHAAITHPAMGLSLDNAVSTKEAPNENLGRELLELHTVGLDGGYTEDDVKASARMLTGYRVDLWWPEFKAFYAPKAHATGRVQVLGFLHENTDRDGREATRAYLSYLAHHPATARRIARRLCVRFVDESPSADLVESVAAAYTGSGTAIRPTLQALVDHPDFLASAGRKVRTPMEDYVASVRALGLDLRRPIREGSFANAMYWQYGELGAPPYEWPAPNGYPEAGSAWTSAGRILNGLDLHLTLAGGWWPSQEVTHRPLRDWLPDLPASLDTVVSEVGRRLLGEVPAPSVREGVATVLGLPLDQRVRRDDLWDGRVVAILASLLDSPTHLHR